MLHDPTRQSNEQIDMNQSAPVAGNDQPTSTAAAIEYFRAYAKERPEVVALWAFGIGFVLGWKLKLW